MSDFLKIQKAVSAQIQEVGIDEQFNTHFYLTSLFFSQLAYFKLPFVEKRLQEIGATEYVIYNHLGTQGFLAKFNDTAVVAFRGTETNKWEDLKTIFQFWKRKYNGIRIHGGFINSLVGIVDAIKTDIDNTGCNRKIYTGHSMGGALATLLAYHHSPTELCTFGEPRVSGGKVFRSQLQGFKYERIVTKHDWIRFLPFGIPKILEYEHVGTEVLLPSKWDWTDWVRPHNLKTYNSLLLDYNKMENSDK